MSIVSKHKVVVQGDIDMSSPLSRITTLENNEYKVTYYEVIQGTSGSLSVPSQGTINSDEFGLSGNAILSKIDANGKPTYQSPTTSLGVAVTTSLDVSTGAWVVSGVYTDPNVAVIYSIRIKAIYYSNLTYNNIIETIDLAVTKTSQLINDGDDGVSHFISLEDLPSNLTLYATNAASDIPTYYKLVTAITDPSYNTTPVNIPTGAITTTGQLIAILATSANVIVGNPGIFNITTIGNIQKLSGTGNAEFYFEVWQRTLAGVETLITTSGSTLPVLNSGYAEFSASALWNNGSFLSTDRIVLKYYADRIVTGSDPTYQFQFGGLSPVRSLVPIPLNVVPVLKLDELQDVTAPTPTNNDVLTYESSTSLWKNKTVTTALGYTPANQDGTILYHSLKWFTPSGTVSSSGTTVTSVGSQFTLAMVGSKLTINGESKIITAVNSSTNVTVASAYSINYSGIAAGSWGVYSKVIEITPNQYSYFSIYDSFGVLNTRTDGTQFYIKNFRTLNNNLNILDTGFVLGGSRNILWTNDTSSSNSVGGVLDTGLRRNTAGVLEIYDGITADGLLANRRDLLVRDITSSSITTPIINGVSGLLSFKTTDNVSVGNYATPSAQRIFTVGQDTGFVSIGSVVGITSWGGIYLDAITPTTNNYALGGSGTFTSLNSSNIVQIGINNSARILVNHQNISFTPGSYAGGAIENFTFTKPNNTNQTLSTSIAGWNYNGGTRQWATGAITAQTENVWGATTYSFVGASTITNAYGNVFNAPIAGTNCTITNNFSAQFNGQVQINGSITNNGGLPSLGSAATPYGTFFITNVRGGSDLTLGSGFSTSGDRGLTMFTSTRNITIQNGGTHTDAGFRLDVNGTGRFQNTLTLATGTTAIAPLKLTAGTNLTTPVSGSFEFDGTNLYFTVGGVRKTVTLI